MIRSLGSALLLGASLSACATTNRGVEDFFRIDTVPQGATVSIWNPDGPDTLPKEMVCEATPCAFRLPRRSTFLAKVEKDGYEPFEMYVSHSSRRTSYSGPLAVNAAASTAAGAATGYFTGMMAGALADVTVTILSLGSVTTNSSASAAASGASSGAAFGAAVGVGMIAVDQASGSSQFIVPSPVVLALVPEGGEVVVDPNAVLYREKKETELTAVEQCRAKDHRTTKRFESCTRRTSKQLWEQSTVRRNMERELEEVAARLEAEAGERPAP